MLRKAVCMLGANDSGQTIKVGKEDGNGPNKKRLRSKRRSERTREILHNGGRRTMTNLTQLSPDDITTNGRQLQARYDAFKARGLKLNLTRGKPSPAQLELSGALLSLPGAKDYLAEDGSDCRNYGGLQGLPEVRRLFSGLMGAAPEEVVASNNSSLALMHRHSGY